MKNILPHLFSPATLGTLSLKNRLLRSATYEHRATRDGHVTDDYLALHRELAAGGVGLIVSGVTYFAENGKLPLALCIGDDKFIPDLTAVAQTVHGLNNGCKIALQIGHNGRQQIALDWFDPPDTMAPSAIIEPRSGRNPRAMSLEEIESFIDDCAAAILRAQKAGIDAIQLHAAHGWLLSSFLTPFANQRNDIYGGSTENRARIITEIIKRAHKLTGIDYPIFVKMNACDFVVGGIELPEALALGKFFANAGCCALEISSTLWATMLRDPKELGWLSEQIPESRKHIDTVKDEAYHRDFARRFKQEIPNTKVILVGGLKTPSLMDEIIASGDADFVSLCRPLLREPDLPNRWLAGSDQRAACISCNACTHPPAVGGVRCAIVHGH